MYISVYFRVYFVSVFMHRCSFLRGINKKLVLLFRCFHGRDALDVLESRLTSCGRLRVQRKNVAIIKLFKTKHYIRHMDEVKDGTPLRINTKVQLLPLSPLIVILKN